MIVARYGIALSQSTMHELVIVDLGPWDEHPTVTNAAESVVEELRAAGALPPGRRLLYYDSLGNLDEIVIECGKVVGFRHLGGDILNADEMRRLEEN